jgi:hypothetical protein
MSVGDTLELFQEVALTKPWRLHPSGPQRCQKRPRTDSRPNPAIKAMPGALASKRAVFIVAADCETDAPLPAVLLKEQSSMAQPRFDTRTTSCWRRHCSGQVAKCSN